MNYQFYGTPSTADEIYRFLTHCLQNKTVGHSQNQDKTPICIWGKHGVGKTELVEQFAKENNFEFVYIAPAQFEEMGDLVGMPSISEGKTIFNPPEWAPISNQPGILLIDDVNRADDRILRGIMQLLQNYELVSWKLPENWHIVLTANPDGGDYSVTPLDDAMLTRMRHITFKFDAKVWAKWAALNQIDQRGINFVLTVPEITQGQRTTPRSLVQFFNAISSIPSLKDNLELVQLLGDASLDATTVTSFIAFITNDMKALIAPETIINAQNFNAEVLEPLSQLATGNSVRVDLLATICTRLVHALLSFKTPPSAHQLNNVKAFLNMDFLPNDLRFNLATDLVNSSNPHLKLIMADPKVSRLLLEKM